MADIRTVTDLFSVAPQLSPDDMAEVGRRGFKLVINNRPDREAPGQPSAAQMRQAAQDAGLDYIDIPFVGVPSPPQVQAVREAVARADGPVLAFCRSGTRSITAWAMGQVAGGDTPRDEIVRLGLAAGYDLSGLR